MSNRFYRTDEKYMVYHYCSVESFFNIIKNKTLWLSDAEYMNDNKEIIWVDEVVKNILLEIKQETLTVEERANIVKFEKAYNSLIHNKHYFISFSEEKDLLSQWRGYANNCSGVCIGFQFGLLPDIIKIASKPQAVSQYQGEQIIMVTTPIIGYEYISYDQEHIKDEILKCIQIDNSHKMSARFIKELATTLKHPSFKEEKEARITYTPSNHHQSKENSFMDKSLSRISKQKYRVSNNQIISYYKLDFRSKYNSLLIPEIKLGPKCKLEEDDLKDFLIFQDYKNTIVTRSESSYR